MKKLIITTLIAGLASFTQVFTKPIMAIDPFIGEIQAFGMNFCPRGWAATDGQLLPISSNTALFSLIGTMYGGDGRTTFALPDLRGRTIIGKGQGPGLSSRRIGARGGQESVVLSVQQIPSHSHKLVAKKGRATRKVAESNQLAAGTGIYRAKGDDILLKNEAISKTGAGQAHDNMMPYTVITYCIALYGTFPSRN